VAAPVGGQIFSEVLPYLEVSQGNQEELEQVEKIPAPDLLGKTLEEAQKVAKENEIELVIDKQPEEIDTKKVITEQIPKAGIIIQKKSKMYITLQD